MAEMTVFNALKDFGICELADAYSVEELARINTAVDPLLTKRADQKRSYVHVDELQRIGLLSTILNERMRRYLFAIMPDPVLYHLIVVETAGNDSRPNLFANTLDGWHRDIDCSFTKTEPTHVSIFVYLSDVGNEDGPFAFVPQNPERWLRSSDQSILVTGRVGYTFAWQRPFFHRASPNRGPRRRRLVKLSIQRNKFPSTHLGNPRFRAAIDAVPIGNTEIDILFGRYQGQSAPLISLNTEIFGSVISPTGPLALSDYHLAKGQLRMRAAAVKRQLQAITGQSMKQPAYD